jgi:hypothetical protein
MKIINYTVILSNANDEVLAQVFENSKQVKDPQGRMLLFDANCNKSSKQNIEIAREALRCVLDKS